MNIRLHIHLICFLAILAGCRKDHIPSSPVQGKPETDTPAPEKPKQVLEVSESDMNCNGDGSTFEFLYMSSGEIEIESEVTWISYIEHNSSIRHIRFRVLRNPEYTTRNGRLTLRLKEYPEISCSVTVTQGMKIPHPALRFADGGTLQRENQDPFRLQLIFEDMDNHSIIWSTSDSKIAEINEDGDITINKSGTCTITAKNHFHNVEASISLNIMIKGLSMKTRLGDQEIKEGIFTIRYIGQRIPLTTVLTPESAYTGDIVAISDNPDIATISEGYLICKKEGITTISVESLYSNLRVSYTLVVESDPISSLT